jgi:hypothetical protein
MPAQTVIKLRRGTASQWTTANPVLAAGEIGLETNTNRTKYGDGVTAWSSLSYSVADASGTSSVDWSSVLNKPATFPPSAHTHLLVNITDVTASASELNILDGATLTTTELNYVDGVTSSIQTQLDGKQAIVSGVSSTEIGYLDGVTSAIQTQIDGKANTSHTHSMQQVHNMPHPFLLMGA